jgi:hypothetical protein
MKLRTVGAELFRADERSDRWTKRCNELNSRFSQFCESVLTNLTYSTS